jgi:hypothetical protein
LILVLIAGTGAITPAILTDVLAYDTEIFAIVMRS